MKNYVRDGDRIPLIAPVGGVVSGLGYLTGALFGVAVGSAAAGAEYTAQIEGVVTLPKGAGVAISQGALVYWDNTNRVVNVTASGNTKIGYAAAAQLAGDATVTVRLHPV
jgi:predicted RecA/RadA family phage recombinase